MKPEWPLEIVDSMSNQTKAAFETMNGEPLTAMADRYGVAPEHLATLVMRTVPTAGVYVLRCPMTDRVRYVGSSTNCTTRIANHAKGSPSRSKAVVWATWLSDLNRALRKIDGRIVEVLRPGVDRSEREAWWLEHFRALGQADLNTNTPGKTVQKKAT